MREPIAPGQHTQKQHRRQLSYVYNLRSAVDTLLVNAGGITNAILGGFGRPGHMAGEFTFLHMMAIDSKGNLYVGETVGGRRVQKFVNCGRDQDDDRGHGRGSRSGCGDDD